MKKAIIIDDAYGLPGRDDLLPYAAALRTHARNDDAFRQWLEAEFSVTGNPRSQQYLDGVLQSDVSSRDFWQRALGSEFATGVQEILAELVQELDIRIKPLKIIEEALDKREWTWETMSALPEVDAVGSDISLIIVDYMLQPEMSENPDDKIRETTSFLASLVARSVGERKGRYPFVLLVSTLSLLDGDKAQDFRNETAISGPFFRFLHKPTIDEHIGVAIDGYERDGTELRAYRACQGELSAALKRALSSLQAQMDSLELQDLATLQVGQLSKEKESVGDYLAWMFGQVLTAKLQADLELAASAVDLPDKSLAVLSGHLKPTQSIPSLFTELSSVVPASALLNRQRTGRHGLRFGDVLRNRGGENGALKPYLLVISQTCDLLHCKLPNGEALCIEGFAHEIENTDVSLLSATVRQMQSAGNLLVRDNGAFLQVDWEKSRLATRVIGDLEDPEKYDFTGRLNEVYAREAQQAALSHLSRVGVPIKPGYGFHFFEASLRVAGGKANAEQFLRTHADLTVCAVIRIDSRKEKFRLLFSHGFRMWLARELNSIVSDASCPADLKQPATLLGESFVTDDYRLVCFESKGKVRISREVEKQSRDGGTEMSLDETSKDKLEVVLNGLSVFGDTAVATGLRFRIELGDARLEAGESVGNAEANAF